MKILVTGGTGYIGSHTCVELLNNNFDVVIIDNLSNSKKEVVNKIEEITKRHVQFYEGDVTSKETLEKIFAENTIDAVIHFAGFKAVGESVSKPLKYYHNNLESTINLLEVMAEHNCKKLVFSSSATVYGKPDFLPIKENFHLSTTNPYGTTKLMIEMMLKDLCISDPTWSVAVLRYFNPIGAHESGLIGESPNDIPNNLMPYIMRVALGSLDHLNVFGNDYETKDGTGVRDYIHVVDLANGHIKAIEKVLKSTGIDYYNLGTGNGYSVLEIVSAFERVNNIKIPYQITSRRSGDIDECYADPTYAFEQLGFKAEKSLDAMCKDAYNFAVQNKE